MIKKWWISYRRKRALRNIRSGMASLGVFVSSYSDEEIERAVRHGSKMLAREGMTVGGMVRAFNDFGDSLRYASIKFIGEGRRE